MESCLSLLQDHVLTQSLPISISTLLDLSPPDVTLSCARRALAQFAIDHQDAVSVTLSVCFFAEGKTQLEIRLIRLEDLAPLAGRILSAYVYSIERANADQTASMQCNDKNDDRDQRLLTYRMSMEHELPMLIREPPIAYPNGGPQRRRKESEPVEEPAAPKRKTDEVKIEKPTKVAKQTPTPATNTQSATNTLTAEMAAFLSGNREDRMSNKQIRSKKKDNVKDSNQSKLRKGVAVVKKQKNPDRKPVCLSNLMDDCDSNQSDEDRDMEIDDVDDLVEIESEREEEEDSNSNNVTSGKDENQAPSSPPKKAFTKQIVQHTYIQDKYLVTEDVVKMTESEVPNQERNSSSTKPTPSKKGPGKPDHTASAGRSKVKKPAKAKQTSIASYFSKR